jgi:pSer/pThr/pTyr-binding forkhead associated (FHA) protein
MAWLAPGGGHEARELRDGELIVGGGAEATWRFSAADLMPRHFVLETQAGSVTVRAFNTDSVVVVNGEQLSGAAHRLNDGDVIAAGNTRFVYTEAEPASRRATPPPPASAYLVDVRAKTAYRLVNRSTGIGRDASNAIIVRDPTASRFHAEVRREAGGFVLHPRGSAGTLVNNRRTGAPYKLEDGDFIEIAFRVLRFATGPLAPDERVAGTTPSPSDELSRRPTIPRDRTPSTQAAIEAASGSRWTAIAIWTGVVLAAAVIGGWILAR